MKVAVLDSQIPFRSGESEWLAGRLCEALRERGHVSELIRIPFNGERPQAVVDQMLAMRLVHLDNVDRAVALRFPAYLLAHEGRVVWLAERFGAAWVSGLPGEVRVSVRAAERAYLGEAARVHAGSALLARTLARDVGVAASVLYAPLRSDGAHRCERYGDYLLLAGAESVTPGVCVAFAALSRAGGSARLVVACAREPTAALRQLPGELGVAGRVELVAAAAGSPGRIALLAGARAVVCVEDACEEVAREAFASRKAVIALADCGCVPGLVRDGVSGRVAATLEELTAAFDEISQDAALAERHGATALGLLAELGISWDAVAAELTR